MLWFGKNIISSENRRIDHVEYVLRVLFTFVYRCCVFLLRSGGGCVYEEHDRVGLEKQRVVSSAGEPARSV